MNNKEINEIINTLSMTFSAYEAELEENGGEYTEDVAKMEEQIALLQQLLSTEGIDSLGRWLKSKEDEITTLKNEKDYISRKIKANEECIEYIKYQMNSVLMASGLTEIKGANGYKFKAVIKTTTEVDKDLLTLTYKNKVDKFVKTLPAHVKVTLGASVSLVPEGQNLPLYFVQTNTPSCTFTKPRASKKTK